QHCAPCASDQRSSTDYIVTDLLCQLADSEHVESEQASGLAHEHHGLTEHASENPERSEQHCKRTHGSQAEKRNDDELLRDRRKVAETLRQSCECLCEPDDCRNERSDR